MTIAWGSWPSANDPRAPTTLLKPKRPRSEPPRGVQTSGSTRFGALQGWCGSDEPRRRSPDIRWPPNGYVEPRFGEPELRLALSHLDLISTTFGDLWLALSNPYLVSPTGSVKAWFGEPEFQLALSNLDVVRIGSNRQWRGSIQLPRRPVSSGCFYRMQIWCFHVPIDHLGPLFR